ncbi:hypothetical protein HDV63DRAFT_138265 [Trichoderma sp. SZMC 28014]
MATIQREWTIPSFTVLLDLYFPRKIRGLAVPRIVRTPDGCLTCRRHGFKCSWGLPTCMTCDKNGYECIQPVSTTGYEEYVRDGDAEPLEVKPHRTKRRKNKNKSRKRRKNNNKNKVEVKNEPEAEEVKIKTEPMAEETKIKTEPMAEEVEETKIKTEPMAEETKTQTKPMAEETKIKTEPMTEDTKTQTKPKSRFDDGVIGWNPDYTPIYQKRDPSTPIPEKTATHPCTRPVPVYASGESGAEHGADPGSASASHPVAESGSTSRSSSESTLDFESESSSASALALTSTTTSESALSWPEFESAFVTRIKRHLYKTQQRKLELIHYHVKRSGSTSSDDVDKDHDYAVYYDYEHEFDPDVLYEDDPELIRLKSDPLAFNLDVVQNSWQGRGEPPLLTRIDDYISYMKHNHLVVGRDKTPLPLTLLPSCDYTASDTLFYYEKRPANCGVADLPDINPVNPKLVRLGYANPLALQLIIAQRSNHREVSSAILPTGESAERFLRDAIAPFGPSIDRYLAGGEDEMPSLFIGSIIIACVERARLDTLCQAYDHPTAAKAILNNLHRLNSEEIFINMPEYLIEYYMHTVSFACVAANPITATGVPFISAPQLTLVDDLAAEGYVGKLCGTWLDILATIPHIFRLGAIMHRRKLGTSTFEDGSDEFLDFFDIEDRLQASAWCGNTRNPSDMWDKVALLFKAAAALYLWSLLDEPLLRDPNIVPIDEDADPQQENWEFDDPDERRIKLHKVFMKQMLGRAELLLPTVMLETDFNLALCWPMLIVGCFTKDSDTQKFIEQRLIAVANQSGVGNSLETLFLLKHIWGLPMSERSPWRIWQYVQDSRCRACTCPRCMPLLF